MGLFELLQKIVEVVRATSDSLPCNGVGGCHGIRRATADE